MSKNNIILIISTLLLGVALYYHLTKPPVNNLDKTIFSFIGTPGSGKGTLAEQCEKKLDFVVLSTGNLCRKNIAKKTELGKKLEKYTNSGKLAPDDLITKMVKEWLTENIKNNKPIILDGYPRTAKQADLFLEILRNDFPEQKFRIISLDIPQEEVVKRIVNRLVCENKNCQAVYNTNQIKNLDDPFCELCSSKLVKREDDREEVVRERLRVYNQTANDLLNFYKSTMQKIETLDVNQKSKEQIFKNFKKIL
ncbi:MAG: nucleoside monophosphate kinase [bacterium]